MTDEHCHSWGVRCFGGKIKSPTSRKEREKWGTQVRRSVQGPGARQILLHVDRQSLAGEATKSG